MIARMAAMFAVLVLFVGADAPGSKCDQQSCLEVPVVKDAKGRNVHCWVTTANVGQAWSIAIADTGTGRTAKAGVPGDPSSLTLQVHYVQCTFDTDCQLGNVPGSGTAKRYIGEPEGRTGVNQKCVPEGS